MNKVPMTARGFDTLKEELRWRQQEERPRIIEAIAEARSPWRPFRKRRVSCAKEQQSLNEGRVNELEDLIARAEVIDVSKLTGAKGEVRRHRPSSSTRTPRKRRPTRSSATRRPT
jgi:transcription elongation factor GreA